VVRNKFKNQVKKCTIYEVQIMTNYDVIKKLIGPIQPIGESNTDEIRYKNLQETILVVDKLLADIWNVSGDSERVEASIKKAGKTAKQFLQDIKDL